MKIESHKLVALIVCCAAFVSAAPLMARTAVSQSTVTFDSVIGDHMVLQRGAPFWLWGQGQPNTAFELRVGELTQQMKVDGSGAWRALLPARNAGGPVVMTLAVDGRVVQTVTDVIFGDVWLCSGQSNMAWPVELANGGAPPPESLTDDIRLFHIPEDSNVVQQADFASPPRWVAGSPEAVNRFSALCYHFARQLREANPVPMGLIDASWGGSRIEAWISAEGLGHAGGFEDHLDLLKSYAEEPAEGSRRFAALWEAWWTGSAGAHGRPWADTEDSATWSQAPDEMQDWNQYGDPALVGHNGMVWFRNRFELSPAQAVQDAELSLGGIDEVDVTWINGQFVGTQFGWGTERSYPVPAGALRAGENLLTVNVLSTWAAGGMVGPSERVFLELQDGTNIPLDQEWRYRKVPLNRGMPPRAPWESISGLTGLYNAMIAPLEGLSLRGVLWYQGESNTGEAENYQGLLRAWVQDWRAQFGQNLAFIIVQLPNFGTPAATPVESGWAALRDAQRRAARADPAVGLVVTIDAGDRYDLHPPHKQIVARRAAGVARSLVYGEGGPVEGLAPSRVSREGDFVVLEFDRGLDDLTVLSDRRPIAFELCGEARGSCVFADARLEGNRIILDAQGDGPYTRVRHCWADAPVCNLYGESGLPVSSFEEGIQP